MSWGSGTLIAFRHFIIFAETCSFVVGYLVTREVLNEIEDRREDWRGEGDWKIGNLILKASEYFIKFVEAIISINLWLKNGFKSI